MVYIRNMWIVLLPCRIENFSSFFFSTNLTASNRNLRALIINLLQLIFCSYKRFSNQNQLNMEHVRLDCHYQAIYVGCFFSHSFLFSAFRTNFSQLNGSVCIDSIGCCPSIHLLSWANITVYVENMSLFPKLQSFVSIKRLPLGLTKQKQKTLLIEYSEKKAKRKNKTHFFVRLEIVEYSLILP